MKPKIAPPVRPTVLPEMGRRPATINRPTPRKAASGREPETTILARRNAELSAVQRIETVSTRPPISLPLQSSGWDGSGIG